MTDQELEAIRLLIHGPREQLSADWLLAAKLLTEVDRLRDVLQTIAAESPSGGIAKFAQDALETER